MSSTGSTVFITLSFKHNPQHVTQSLGTFSRSDIQFRHWSDVIMRVMVSQITNLTIVYSTVYSGADQKKTSKLRVTGLSQGNSPVTGEFRHRWIPCTKGQ